VVEEWGRLDVLVNNAGILKEAPLEELTDEDFQETLDVNLRGAMVCARAAAPHMIRQGRGRLLSAAFGLDPPRRGGLTAYAAAKGRGHRDDADVGPRAGPRASRRTWSPRGSFRRRPVRTVPPDELEATLARIPARRLGTPEEVAAVYLFLASDLASFITTGRWWAWTGGCCCT